MRGPKTNNMGRGHIHAHIQTQTLRLLDRIAPVGQFGDKTIICYFIMFLIGCLVWIFFVICSKKCVVKTRLFPRTTACVCPVYRCMWPCMTSSLQPFRCVKHSSCPEKTPHITLHFFLISCISASYVINGHF